MLFTKVIRTIARNGVRQLTTPAVESTASAASPKTSIAVPPWGLVGIGITAAGFFGKMLHDDNLATRTELQEVRRQAREDNIATRTELRGDIKAIEGDIKTLERNMEHGFKTINDSIASLRPHK